jgi:2-oxoglutarate ferredoxin oxidoreductase subunit beta
MKFYKQVSKIRNGAPTTECAITQVGEIVVGKFVDRDRPDYMELLKARMSETLGERFAEPQCISEDGGYCEGKGATVCS